MNSRNSVLPSAVLFWVRNKFITLVMNAHVGRCLTLVPHMARDDKSDQGTDTNKCVVPDEMKRREACMCKIFNSSSRASMPLTFAQKGHESASTAMIAYTQNLILHLLIFVLPRC